MSAGYSLTTLDNFRGGLNYRTDAFDLELNESPDLLNVSVDPRGGISLREGVTTYNQNEEASDIQGIWSLYKDDGTNKVLVNYGTAIAAHDGTDFADLSGPTARTDGSRVYGTTMNNRAYGVSFDKPSFYYDGSTAADLGTTLDGTTGNFPQAKYVAHWNNFAWVGYTKESSVNYPTRIRFSNANLAEQWDDLDFIDIGKGEGGDYITGVLGHNDRLMIFKTNSTYALFGFDGDTFQLITISESIGMTAESTAVSTPYGVFFWNDRQGVYLYDGNNMVWLFEKLKPAIDDGRITFANPPQLGWANNKLYLSVDYYDGDTNTTSRRMFVYDPTIGAWVLWDVDAAALHTHHPPDGEPVLYGACVANTGRVVSIDAGGTSADRYTYTSGAYVSTNIASHFQTAWIKTRNPIVKKRWGQIRLVTSAEQTGTLRVDVFHDYDTSTTAKRMADSELAYDVPITGRQSSASTWDTATYQLAPGESGTAGNGIWASGANAQITDIKKIGSGGTASSLCIRITGPTQQNAAWEVNGASFPYKSRRMR